MAKKQILRNINKNNKSNKKTEQEDNFNKFVTTLALILLVLILVYFMIGVFFTKEIKFGKKEEKKTEEKSDVSIDNSTITAGQIFDKNDESYYVVIYDFDSKLTNIGTFISLYKGKEDSLPIYKVDSGNKLNGKFIVESNSNKEPTSYSDLKIKSPTLIKIENGEVTSYVEDEDEIKSILKK